MGLQSLLYSRHTTDLCRCFMVLGRHAYQVYNDRREHWKLNHFYSKNHRDYDSNRNTPLGRRGLTVVWPANLLPPRTWQSPLFLHCPPSSQDRHRKSPISSSGSITTCVRTNSCSGFSSWSSFRITGCRHPTAATGGISSPASTRQPGPYSWSS